MAKNIKKSIHESVVDDSFEELKHLSAVAGDEAEALDDDDDTGDDDDDTGDEDETTEDEVEDDEVDAEDLDDDGHDENAGDDDEINDESDSDDDEDEDETYEEVEESDDEGDEGNEYSDDEDETTEDEADSDDEDGSDDEEITEEDDEGDVGHEEDEADSYDDEADDCEADEEVDEDEILAALQEEGLIAVITTADQIDESDFAVAVADMEDGDDEDATAGEDDDEDVYDSEEDDADDDDDDEITEDVEDDDDSAEAGEEADADDDDDDEDEITEDEDEADSDDDEDEVTDDSEEDDDNAEASEDEIDAERLAPVASMEFLAHASVSDVELVLYRHQTNPVWNVIVAGVPAASISLASYGDAAQEVAGFFTTTKFENGVKQAMASEGVLGLLKKSNAEFYANAYKSSDVFVEARAAAEKVGNQKVTAATAGLREDFIDAMKVASAGMDKNFFQKPNPLKRSLYIALSNAGIQNPQYLIETVFAESSVQYFETVADVAVDFLDTPVEARDRIRQAIESSGVIDRGIAQASTNEPRQEEDASKSALALIRGMKVSANTAELPTVTGSVSERKDSLRSLLK